MNGAALSREDQTIKRHARERVSSRGICFVAGARFPAWLPAGPFPLLFRSLAQGRHVPSAADWLWSDSGAAHASPLRRESIIHAGPLPPSNQLFEHQA